MEIYGAAVADKLDGGRGILRRRYYRQHCTLDYGSYTKDLAAICPDLASIFILDNSPGAYRQYPGGCSECFLCTDYLSCMKVKYLIDFVVPPPSPFSDDVFHLVESLQMPKMVFLKLET